MTASTPPFHPPRPPRHRLPEPRTAAATLRAEPAAAYGRPFWLAYLSNSLIGGRGVAFRYADFVTLLGGTEFHLGWIVGVGMVGSLLIRLALGSCIDRYGPSCLARFGAIVCGRLLRPSDGRQPHGRGHLFAAHLVLLRRGRHRRHSTTFVSMRAPTVAWPNWSACWAPPVSWASSAAPCSATSCSARSRSPRLRWPRCLSPPACWPALAAVRLAGHPGRVGGRQLGSSQSAVKRGRGERGEGEGRVLNLPPSANPQSLIQ